jgi:hypothetical protein
MEQKKKGLDEFAMLLILARVSNQLSVYRIVINHKLIQFLSGLWKMFFT